MKKQFEAALFDYSQGVLSLERTIREYWHDKKVNATGNIQNAPYSYVLGMFPYPSGNAHMGHALVYSLTDTTARLKRFQGENVLHPLGWDAFGLPAENAANKNNIHPAAWTESNIRTMRDEQIGQMGFSFDPARELNTSSPEYYKWTQWLFLQLYKAGLVYRAEEWVNWDPIDNTVLANEQVVDGKGWRSGATIERRKMEQWYIRITDYAERLHQGLNHLPGWSDAAKSAQRYWIGRSEGSDIDFNLHGHDKAEPVSVFTTRPETLFGATALVLAPENEKLDHFLKDEFKRQVLTYRQQALRKSEVDRISAEEKTGVATGIEVVHPLTGQVLPVYVADYVLNSHGTGAVMCVPAHDSRDYDFASAMGLSSIQVIDAGEPVDLPYTEAKGTLMNSGDFDGMVCENAAQAITEKMQEMSAGGASVRYKLKDWPLGRQRFWGAPIPMLQDQEGNWLAVPEDQLPVTLPAKEEIDFSAAKGRLSLETMDDFVHFAAQDGQEYTRETDTMDTFMCSSWYAWRFLGPQNDDQAWDPEEAFKWMPIDTYVGGLEHANQHLIYFRFMSYFLYDQGLTPSEEPIKKFLNNGMVQMGGTKMSKSKGNIVRPDDMIEKYGADALHMYILSTGPHDRNFEWREEGLRHKQAFLGRIYKLYREVKFSSSLIERLEASDVSESWSKDLLAKLDKTAKGIEQEILDHANYHVAIAKTHEFANEIFSRRAETNTAEREKVYQYVCQNFLKILGITAPHISEHLWQRSFDIQRSLFQQPWVNIDPALLPTQQYDFSVPVMINGKKRAEYRVSALQSDDEIIQGIMDRKEELALDTYFHGAAIGKTIVVRDKRAENAPKMVNLQLVKNHS